MTPIRPRPFKDSIIVTDRPTTEMMARAKAENLMVFVFMHKPASVIDYATSQSFQEGWLLGLGLKPDPRLALVTIPTNLDLESAKAAYLSKLEENVDGSIFTPRFADILTPKGSPDFSETSYIRDEVKNTCEKITCPVIEVVNDLTVPKRGSNE